MSTAQTAAAQTITLDELLTAPSLLDEMVETPALDLVASATESQKKLFTLRSLRELMAQKGIKNSLRLITKDGKGAALPVEAQVVSMRVAAGDVTAAICEVAAFGLDIKTTYKVAGGFVHLHIPATQFWHNAAGLKPALCAKPYKTDNNPGTPPVFA